jgi:AcrR family transcriptional regulator
MPPPRLPPAPKYRETPPWEDNFDNVEVRTLNAAWNALFTTDLAELTFSALADEVGVTPAAIYHHFPTLSTFGGAAGSAVEPEVAGRNG